MGANYQWSARRRLLICQQFGRFGLAEERDDELGHRLADAVDGSHSSIVARQFVQATVLAGQNLGGVFADQADAEGEDEAGQGRVGAAGDGGEDVVGQLSPMRSRGSSWSLVRSRGPRRL